MDSAVYQDGGRLSEPATIEDTVRCLRDRPGAHAWIGLYRPHDDDVVALGADLGLHPLAVEDAIHAHQRPKIERYGDTLFIVLRAARSEGGTGTIDFGELHVFVGPAFVVTLRHGLTPDLRPVREGIEANPELLAHGPRAVLHAVLDAVVDDYAPIVAELEEAVDALEQDAFSVAPGVSRRIYALTREVVELQRAVHPLLEVLAQLDEELGSTGPDDPVDPHFRNVADHVVRADGRIDTLRNYLKDMLTVNATLVNEAQNDDVKRISSWAAIGLLPTLVASIYGMNFDDMPELRWAAGYPLALGLMVLSSVVLYVVFKRRRWL